jgi:hypothetical protein
LADFNFDQPKTLAEADAIRSQLNAENKAVLKKNSYDVATALAADPGFAAREAAAESLRDGIYQRLEHRFCLSIYHVASRFRRAPLCLSTPHR